jgi:hypothetical protein
VTGRVPVVDIEPHIDAHHFAGGHMGDAPLGRNDDLGLVTIGASDEAHPLELV